MAHNRLSTVDASNDKAGILAGGGGYTSNPYCKEGNRLIEHLNFYRISHVKSARLTAVKPKHIICYFAPCPTMTGA